MYNFNYKFKELLTNYALFLQLQNVFAVLDLYGMVESVSVVSNVSMVTDSTSTTPSVESETGHQISLVNIYKCW